MFIPTPLFPDCSLAASQNQLLYNFGACNALASFALIFVYLSIFIFTFKTWLLETCENGLLTQIENNGLKISSEAASVFAAEIAVGLSITSTIGYGIADAWSPLNGLGIGTLEDGFAKIPRPYTL